MGLLRKLFGATKGTTTDVLELLESQHKEVDELIARIENRDGNVRSLFTELADKLAAHATVEEKLFYPAVMAKDTQGQLREAVEEHLSIKRLLADLITLTRKRRTSSSPKSATCSPTTNARHSATRSS